MIAVNLGSGQRKFPAPWTNVDANVKWEPDIVAHGDYMPMFPDESVDLIVAHHVIEHVGLGEFDPTIKECWRVLNPGGSLIITTPDLDALTRAYIRQTMPDGRPFGDYLFCVNLYGAYMDDEADRHKWLYNGRTLAKALNQAAPWDKVGSFDWRNLAGANIARDWWVLGVEAVKA